MTRIPDWHDRIFLSGIVVLSGLPYLYGLGLYSDDYAFLAAMSEVAPHGLGALLGTLNDSPNLHPRPLQSAYLAFLYWAFGFEPLPAHLLNHAVFGAAILSFHAGMRCIGVPRLCAVALPLILASMPHYATVRFWLAANQVALAMMAFFLSFLLAALYARDEAHRWRWLCSGATAIVVSGMAYETFLPLSLLIPLVVWLPRLLVFHPWPRCAPSWNDAVRPLALQLLVYGLTTAAVVWVKMALYRGHRVVDLSFSDWLRTMDWLIRGVVRTTFVENGVKLPAHAMVLLRDHWHADAVIAASIAFVAIFAWLLPIARTRPPERRLPLILGIGLLGFVVFLTGYAAFANNFNIGFSPTGIANRAAAAGSIGAAMVALAVALLLGAMLPAAVARRIVPAAVALGCSTGILVNGTLGKLWVEAAQEQQTILAQIRSDLPHLSGATILLLDGICPFVGPAPVFESAWDLEGALRLLYIDPKIRADVVKPDIEIGAQAIATTLYGTLRYEYPYGNLMVYNARARQSWPLPDREAALNYFNRFNPANSTGCAFQDGSGVAVY